MTTASNYGYTFNSSCAYDIDSTYISDNWAPGAATAITDAQFGLGLGGGTVTPTAGSLSGVTIKWERGPDGTVNQWKA